MNTTYHPDPDAIYTIIKQLDEILTGPHEELVPRLQSLAFEVDHMVPYHDGHMIRVTFFSLAIGLRMKLPPNDLLTLEIAALLHDFGKVIIDCSMLVKRGQLTESETAIIHKHVERGYKLLSGFKKLEWVASVILDHHERFDGCGYPGRKSGSDILLLSRIIAVADSYDAMTANRPYRMSLSHNEAVEELVRESGRQFDPTVVKHFLSGAEFARTLGRALLRDG